MSLQTSSGVNDVRTTSFADRLTQYLPSYIHSFVKSIVIREIHLPAAEKLWHIPDLLQFPIPVPSPFLSTPLEVHATSYFAASERILSLSYKLISVWIFPFIPVYPSQNHYRTFVLIIILAHTFDSFNCIKKESHYKSRQRSYPVTAL